MKSDLTFDQTEQLEKFAGFVISHKHLTTAFEKSFNAVCRTTGPRVVIVTGPTGVGKSTLADRLYKRLLTAYEDEMAADPGFVPVATTTAVAPNNNHFGWKDYYYRFLEKYQDPLVERKLAGAYQSGLFDEQQNLRQWANSNQDALRRGVERYLHHRRTKVLIIDEAHHILMVDKPGTLECQFETLKSLTIETNTTIVLVGTYRLLDIREYSGQLVRRSQIVHLPRYDVRNPEDRQVFTNFAHSMLRQLPITTNVAPDVLMDYFYDKTGGCVGILKDWLARCLEECLKGGKSSYGLEDLEEHYVLDNSGMCTIVAEAKAGEARLKDVSKEEVRRLLYEEDVPRSSLVFPSTQKKRSRSRIGERLPVRDPVGGALNVANA